MLKKVSSVFQEKFTKSCCMDLIAATRAELGLVYVVVFYLFFFDLCYCCRFCFVVVVTVIDDIHVLVLVVNVDPET